jgi:GNAT superfamily N-acetyltransferase
MMSRDQSLMALTETSLADLYIRAAEVAGGEFVQEEYYCWTKNPYADRYGKIFNIRIPGKRADTVLRKLCDDMAQGPAPKNILLGPTSLPCNLAERLAGHNFNKVYTQTGMALELTQLGPLPDDEAGHIRVVDSGPALAQWLLVAAAAFGKTRNPALFQCFMREKDFVLYAGYLHDRMVATTMLHIKSAVAGIHLVGTLPEYRGRGFATALTCTALRDAREKGCTIGALQASAMGESVYRKIGFNGYGTISHWEFLGNRDDA